MNDPMTVGEALLMNANYKKRSHGRSQSYDTATFCCDEIHSNKGGKIRRKLQWTVKDLLASTSSLIAIDDASVGSGEGTCATETTVHSLGSIPNSSNHSKTSSHPEKSRLQKFIKEKSKLQLLTSKALPERDQSKRVSTGKTSNTLVPNIQAEGKRKLIPRLPKSFLESTLSVENNKVPIPEGEKQRNPSSPFTPAAISAIVDDDDSTDGTSLTPISPMRLSFDDMRSVDDPSSTSTSYASKEFSVALFQEDPPVGSPLTPSPQIRSPPMPRRARVPRTFLLERIVSESNLRTALDTSMQDSQLYPEPPSDCSTMTADTGFPIEMVLNELSQDHEHYCDDGTMLLLCHKTTGACRSNIRSVPVDVDDVKFVDVEENLHTLGEMAEDCIHRREYDEAIDILKEILRGNIKKHGLEHESIGTCLHNIGSVQMKQRNFSEAGKSLAKAIEYRIHALGNMHPDVAASLVQLGLVRFEMGQYEPALEAFQAALRIRHVSLGPRCLKVAKVLNNIGATLKQLQINTEAILAFEECLQLQKEALTTMCACDGQEDGLNGLSLGIASTLSNISTVKLAVGLIEEALVALDEAYEIQRCILGEEHPEVKETLQGINYLCKTRARRDFDEAIEVEESDVNDRTALIPAMKDHCQKKEHLLRNMKLSPPKPVTRISLEDCLLDSCRL